MIQICRSGDRVRSGDMSGTLVQKGCVTQNKASFDKKVPCSESVSHVVLRTERTLRFCLVTAWAGWSLSKCHAQSENRKLIPSEMATPRLTNAGP
jgi:hypothetical protein